MNTDGTPNTGRAEHAWFEVSRVALPKRSAEERVADFHEIYGCFTPEVAQEQARRCLFCPDPGCVAGCPVSSRISEWILLTAEGRFLEAAAACRSNNNLPEICARVCPHDRLCEGACILSGQSEAVAIGGIEKFLAEYGFAHGGMESSQVQPNGMKVAVLGSGPVGLTCADELARRGYAVTVFEARSQPGGLLTSGVASFKLEREVVERRFDLLRQRGVDFRLGQAVGRDVHLPELREEYDAIFVGFGAQRPRPLTIPGADLVGVMTALPFVTRFPGGTGPDGSALGLQGRRVVVLGGGETAMDCLRLAVRSGAAEADCVYRRDAENMPGSRREYENAVEEGARFQFLAMPVEVLGDSAGQVRAVRCLRTELGDLDHVGRRVPRPVPGTDFEVPADLVVVAFGFEGTPLPKECDLSSLRTTDSGTLVVDAHMMTNLEGVFAGGDIIRGPGLVVHAVRDARNAAIEIHRYLGCKRFGELCPDQTDHVSGEGA